MLFCPIVWDHLHIRLKTWSYWFQYMKRQVNSSYNLSIKRLQQTLIAEREDYLGVQPTWDNNWKWGFRFCVKQIKGLSSKTIHSSCLKDFTDSLCNSTMTYFTGKIPKYGIEIVLTLGPQDLTFTTNQTPTIIHNTWWTKTKHFLTYLFERPFITWTKSEYISSAYFGDNIDKNYLIIQKIFDTTTFCDTMESHSWIQHSHELAINDQKKYLWGAFIYFV